MAAADQDLEAEIDRLYGTAPEDFVGEREGVARRLRGERRRDEAKQVHALRKPSQVAWAINRVVRRKPELVEEVMSTGDALGEAQLALASGGGADTLRAAAVAHQQAVNRFAQAAREVLAQSGVASDEALRRVHETLLASATDAELADQVRAGRVVKEQAPVGFGPLGAAPVPAPTKPTKPKPGKSADAPARRRRDAEAKEDERRRVELQARVREARATEARAHEEAARLEAELEKAETRRRKAADKLEESTQRLAHAEAEAAELETPVTQARAEAERASALLRELEAG